MRASPKWGQRLDRPVEQEDALVRNSQHLSERKYHTGKFLPRLWHAPAYPPGGHMRLASGIAPIGKCSIPAYRGELRSRWRSQQRCATQLLSEVRQALQLTRVGRVRGPTPHAGAGLLQERHSQLARQLVASGYSTQFATLPMTDRAQRPKPKAQSTQALGKRLRKPIPPSPANPTTIIQYTHNPPKGTGTASVGAAGTAQLAAP